MTIQTLTLGKKKFVVLPEKDFLRLQKQAQQLSAQDKGDIAESKRRQHEPSIPLPQMIAEDRRDATTLRRRLASMRRRNEKPQPFSQAPPGQSPQRTRQSPRLHANHKR
jgi:hypothetical protein